MRPEARAVAYRLRAMLELCITPPDSEVAPLLSWECTETALMDAFKLRDPLGVGFASVWELRLVRKLLSWDPSERPTASQALEHAFFREDGRGWRCAQGDSTREFEWLSECSSTCDTMCE
jgi:serine/threonine protein kinase